MRFVISITVFVLALMPIWIALPIAYNLCLPLVGLAYIVTTLRTAKDGKRFKYVAWCLSADLAMSAGLSCLTSIIWISATMRGGAGDIEFTRNMFLLVFVTGPIFLLGAIGRIALYFSP